MDDVDLIYFVNLFIFKIQLSCHMEKVNWAMWINLKWSNMDDWDYKFHKKIWFIYYLISKFQNALLVPHDNKRTVTILITIFWQIVTSCICIINGWRLICWPYVSSMDCDEIRNDVIICDYMLDATSLMQLMFV
jgi:hypothetical protein